MKSGLFENEVEQRVLQSSIKQTRILYECRSKESKVVLICPVQVILAGTLTGVQGDIRCKVLAVLSTVK